MRIVYVYPQMVDHAGTERILIDKMNYLADIMGYDVVLLTYEQCNRKLAFSLSEKVRHVDLNILYYQYFRRNYFSRFYHWHRLDKILQSKFNDFMSVFCPDVVITSTFYVKPLQIISSCPIPCVRILESHIDRRYIMNNNPVNQVNSFKQILGKIDMCYLTKYAKRFDLLVALNQSDADDWSRYLETTVITNMVHLNPTGKIAKLENKNVIFVGRYTLQKGIPDLFKIWQLVHLRFPDWHLHLYGEGEMRDEIVKMAEQMNSNIHVNEQDENIFDRYLESSVFVLTSLYEPFGLVMPEAMSCGVPVVAFDCPEGPAKIISDGIDGFLIPNRNATLFAEKLCKLIESHELRLQMGAAAIVASQRYSSSKIMPSWLNLFEKYCNSSRN